MPPANRKKLKTYAARFFMGVGIAATVLILLVVLALWRLSEPAPQRPDKMIVTINLDQPVVEQLEPSPLDFALHEESISLLDILHGIDSARTDPDVKALVVKFGGIQPTLAQAEEIRSAIVRFKASGKPTYAYGTSYGDFGTGNRAYFLASVFDNIWLQPVGAVSLTGVAVEAPFGKGALDKLGVNGNFLHREEYKSFSETFTRENFSPPVRANMQNMLDDLAEQVAVGIADGRKWDVAKVKQLMTKGPYTAEEALKLGLVTHIGHADELDKELDTKVGEDAEEVDVEDYLGFGGDSGKSKPKARVALIYGTGLITSHSNGPADMSGEGVMSADKVAGAFNDATDDKKIKAILFRVDSPGGSPEASETIRAAMLHAQKAGKPVYVSMGSVAASGGYWVSMSADNITAEPGTITGSIGVVAGKFVIGGLAQKLGVTFDTLTAGGGSANLWSMAKEFTPEQLERMNAFLDSTYHVFVKDVSDGRKIPMDKMPDVAKGRVFTGAQAKKIGLVDQLGGYDVALAELRKKLELKPDDVLSVEVFPAPLSPAEKVMKILKGVGIEGAMIRSALGQWRMAATIMAPFLDATEQKPVSARIVLPVIR